MKLRMIAITALALMLAGCTSSEVQTANRNLLATLCANGATLLAQVPTGPLTPAQVTDIQNTACSTAFGTTAAPASAPGMGPVFPPPATPSVPASMSSGVAPSH